MPRQLPHKLALPPLARIRVLGGHNVVVARLELAVVVLNAVRHGDNVLFGQLPANPAANILYALAVPSGLQPGLLGLGLDKGIVIMDGAEGPVVRTDQAAGDEAVGCGGLDAIHGVG